MISAPHPLRLSLGLGLKKNDAAQVKRCLRRTRVRMIACNDRASGTLDARTIPKRTVNPMHDPNRISL